jgi:hypothetical protein
MHLEGELKLKQHINDQQWKILIQYEALSTKDDGKLFDTNSMTDNDKLMMIMTIILSAMLLSTIIYIVWWE